MLLLRAHVSPGVRAQARTALAASGYRGPQEPATEAVWLHVALAAAHDAHEAPGDAGAIPDAAPADPADPDLDRDLDRLERIAAVFTARPIVAAARSLIDAQVRT
ncbi:MAG: hypothetical protein HOV79_13470 [Hamadaea sp.]|nr:hypothetical protein [Hamadaea sp.]